MLVLNRNINESIMIGHEIKIKVLSSPQLTNGIIRLGVSAPIEIIVYREEIFRKFFSNSLNLKKQNKLENHFNLVI